MCKSCSHFACKVASMQRRMCGFSGILARGPNLPFVYFFEMEQATKPAPTRRVFPSTPLLPTSPVDVFDCANYSTPLDFVCIQSTSLLPSSCIPGQAQDMCGSTSHSASALVTYSSCPYQLCVMVKSHFNSTKLLLSSRSFHMLDNHPNTLHLPSHSDPGSAWLP